MSDRHQGRRQVTVIKTKSKRQSTIKGMKGLENRKNNEKAEEDQKRRKLTIWHNYMLVQSV